MTFSRASLLSFAPFLGACPKSVAPCGDGRTECEWSRRVFTDGGPAEGRPEDPYVLRVTLPDYREHRSEPFGKFVNVAVLEGDQIKIVDEGVGHSVPDCPAVVTSLAGAPERASHSGLTTVLIQLAASMRQHGRGGALLVVPSGSQDWRESIVTPISYAVDPPYAELSRLVCATGADPDDLTRAVDAIAGLTAVDGATIITDRYDLLAFGAKIARRRGRTPVELVNVTEPVEGSAATRATPAQLGGTRHLSAAQFVHDQHDATALVASQDGRFTIFKWSPRERFVHAHRVDALLL